MTVIALFKSFLVGTLTAYLAFTNTLAEYIESFLPQQEIPSSEEAPLEHTETTEELVLLSRLYGSTAGAARILRDDLEFQKAFNGNTATVALSASETITDEAIEASLVNIWCEYETKRFTHTTTGTGFFVSEEGVILTNAHVAQFLLLEALDSDIEDASCVIRGGSPATPQYTADLLFISPTWILKNAELISAQRPQGTGEYDYALLYVSSGIDDTELPRKFPALPLWTSYVPRSYTGVSITVAGYPAEKMLREGSDADLIPKLAETKLDELYTFGSNYADIFAIAPSRVGEQGVSGGPVVKKDKGVIGLIVTKGDIDTDGATSLRALTISYIDRTIAEETGFSLQQNLVGDLSYRGKIFKKALVAPLAKLLSFELQE